MHENNEQIVVSLNGDRVTSLDNKTLEDRINSDALRAEEMLTEFIENDIELTQIKYSPVKIKLKLKIGNKEIASFFPNTLKFAGEKYISLYDPDTKKSVLLNSEGTVFGDFGHLDFFQINNISVFQNTRKEQILLNESGQKINFDYKIPSSTIRYHICIKR
jgi:hypothetical protein